MTNYELGIAYISSKEYGLAFAEFRRGAAQCVKCQQMLGVCYALGYGVEADAKQAEHLFTSNLVALYRLAHKNDSSAQILLANYYFHPEFNAQNLEKAYCWYEAAAQNGNESAKFNLANCLFFGYGTTANHSRAIQLLSELVENGHKEAIYNYAAFVQSTKSKSVAELYRLGAEMGCYRCMHGLGAAYVNGIGTSVNIQEGIKWLKKAADHGFYPSIKLLEQHNKLEVQEVELTPFDYWRTPK